MKSFTLVFTGSVILTEGDLWPDDDAPENPTKEDVEELLEEYEYDIAGLIRDWNLEDEISVKVDDGTAKGQ